MKSFYCSICDKTLSSISRTRHNKSSSHIKLMYSVVERFILNNIKVEDTDEVLTQHINDYKKKFDRFMFNCKISSHIVRG